MIKVSAYSPQRYNNQQLKKANNPSFGMKAIQPPETLKGLDFVDFLHNPPKLGKSPSDLLPPKPPVDDTLIKIADGKDSPFHML